MKKWISLLLASWSALASFGQLQIKGKISDRQGDLRSVTVLLMDLDSAMLKGVVTDDAGDFLLEHIAPGNYILSASMVGYARFYSKTITVSRDNVIVPPIILEESVTALGEIVVTAEKQLLEQKIDRLIVNLNNSITSSGNTVLEVLQKSPGIVLSRQNNTITLNGRSGVSIMINEKFLQVPLDVALQMMEGMNASNVEKIELITSPPAAYDAEGNAGIIHIVTRRSADLGTRGSIGLTVGHKWAETLGGNFNLNHRNKKLAYFLDYSIMRDHNLHILKMHRRSTDSEFNHVTDSSYRENVATQQNVSTGFELALNKNIVIHTSITGYRRNWEMDGNTIDINRIKIDSTVITNMGVFESNIWQSATASVGLQAKVNSKTELNFNLDYLYYHNNNPSHYNNNIYYLERKAWEKSYVDLKKNTPIRFVIAKADYRYDISPDLTVEGGIKASTSELTNDVKVQRRVQGEWVKDPMFSSYSSLSEKIGAIYVSTKWRSDRGWQIDGGLRFELTFTAMNTLEKKDLVRREYAYLFPGLSIKKVLGSGRNIHLSYSKRITRPTYNDMAPYVFFWGAHTFSAGNTYLYPAISESIMTSYQFRRWIISLQFSHTKNEINSLQPEFDVQSNNLTYRAQNLRYSKSAGMTSSYSFALASWWEMQTNISAQYQVAETSHQQETLNMQNYRINLNVVNVIKLRKGFAMEISGMYQSKSLSGVTEFLSYGSLNAGIQKDLGKKGTLRLAIDDIFNTNNWRIKSNSPVNNLNSYFNYNWHNRFLRLTYTRNLGNNKLMLIKMRSGSEEERRRVVN